MTYDEAKQLATTLYWTASSKHDVDDQQWRFLFNIFNRKYWNDVARATGSLFAKDSPDLVSDAAGMFDYSGNLFYLSDLTPGQITNLNVLGGWTLTNVTTATGFFAPDNSNTAWQMSDTALNQAHKISLAAAPTWQGPNGSVAIYAKAGTIGFAYLTDNTSTVWFDLNNGVLGSTSGTTLVGSISPMPAPSFTTALGQTTGSSPVLSMNGWYKISVKPTTTGSIGLVSVGMANADGVTSYLGTANGNIYLWGPRKAYQDNMVEPVGVRIPMAVELKFLGRYIHLDYEIPQDRFIYNIAFGQVQVLIPTAWTVMGEKIVMLPRTSGLQTFRMTYMPKVGDMYLNTQHFLNGYLPEWHQLIVYDTVASMLRQEGPETRPILQPLIDMRKQWNEFLVSRQRQEGRKIRFVPYE